MRVYSKILREADAQVRYGNTEHIGDGTTRQSRVLCAAGTRRVMLDTQLEDPDLLALQQTGRWKEVAIFMDGGG